MKIEQSIGTASAKGLTEQPTDNFPRLNLSAGRIRPLLHRNPDTSLALEQD